MRRRLLAPGIVLACVFAPASVLATAQPALADTLRVIPVPTANAGLGRVTALPDGTVFFQEADGNKFGYFGPSGTVAETALYGGAGPDQLTAMDVAPDGRVWTAIRNPETIVTSQTRTGTDAGALGPQGPPVYRNIRTTADSFGWLARAGGGTVVIADIDPGGGYSAVGAPGSSTCSELIGLGGDGHVWCTTSAGMMSLSTSAAGPVRAVPGGAGFVRAIGPGPGGSTWFARYEGGSLVTPVNGALGWVDPAGAVHSVNTGARTAPTDLAMGPDGTIWFTSAGDAAGIGHISPNGTGALTALPGYSPRHLTVLTDGTIVATDPVHNVVLAVSPTVLQTTNVDPGAGSVFNRPVEPGSFKGGKKPLRVRHGRVSVPLACPASATAGCAGTAVLVARKGKHPALTKVGSYALVVGASGKVKLKFSKKGLKAVPSRRTTKLRLELFAQGATAPAVVQVVKVRR
jgi:streptogramin lyase